MSHKPLIILSLALTLLISFDYLAAWTVPSTNPPSGNIAAPLNTGETNQFKDGVLGVLGLNAATALDGDGSVIGGVVRAENQMRSNQYCDMSGENCFSPADIASIIASDPSNGGSYTRSYNGGSNMSSPGPYSYQETGSVCRNPNPLTSACSCPAGFIASVLSSTMGTTAYNSGDGDYRSTSSATRTYQCTPS